MKRLVVVLLVIGFFVTLLSTDEKEVIEKAVQYFREKEYAKALDLVDEAINESGLTKNLMRFKSTMLVSMGKYEEALSLLDKGIQTFGESPELLMRKLFLQIRLKKYRDALKTALRKEEIVKEKSPFECMDVVEVYIKLNNTDKAFEWLDKAVDRGFNSLKALDMDLFKPLAKDTRFEKIRAKIRDKIGLEKAAKDFTVKLYKGGSFQLSKQQGKVVLIDFWATWCAPCRHEIPNLKKYYQTFNAKGFEIIGISLDRQEESIKQYLEKEKLPWKISYSGKFWDDDTARLYNVNSIPSYWLIDKKGVLRYFGLRGESLKKAIEELLNEMP